MRVIRHLFKPMEGAASRVNLTAACGLWAIVAYQCRIISSNGGATVAGDVDNGGSHACVRAGGAWEILLILP